MLHPTPNCLVYQNAFDLPVSETVPWIDVTGITKAFTRAIKSCPEMCIRGTNSAGPLITVIPSGGSPDCCPMSNKLADERPAKLPCTNCRVELPPLGSIQYFSSSGMSLKADSGTVQSASVQGVIPRACEQAAQLGRRRGVAFMRLQQVEGIRARDAGCWPGCNGFDGRFQAPSGSQRPSFAPAGVNVPGQVVGDQIGNTVSPRLGDLLGLVWLYAIAPLLTLFLPRLRRLHDSHARPLPEGG